MTPKEKLYLINIRRRFQNICHILILLIVDDKHNINFFKIQGFYVDLLSKTFEILVGIDYKFLK